MHWTNFAGRSCLLVAGLVVLLVCSGCAAVSPPPNVKAVNCATADIQWEVAAEAEIVDFSCAMGQHEGEAALIYTVALKNVSERPLRFRLTIFLLDLDKAVAYLVPVKGKPPQVAAGATETVKIPFMKTTAMPGSVQVRVVPMRED